MKKCGNCGAVQNDARTVCIDCGERLGRPMSDAEAAQHMSALDKAVEHMTDPSDDFAVPRRDKIMGALALVSIVVLCVLLCVIGVVEDRYQPEYPKGAALSASGTGAVFFSPGEGVTWVENPYIDEQQALEQASLTALCGVLMFAFAAFLMFFPRAVWYLDTSRIRRYISGELAPSRAWVVTHKIVQYVAFAVGWCCVIAVIWLIP